MLFQKEIANVVVPESPLFAEYEAPASPFADRGLAAAGALAAGSASITTGPDEENRSYSRSWRRRAASLSRSS
jgi:hypothetical protein